MTPLLTVAERDEEQERLLGIVFNLAPSQAAVVSCLLRSVTVTTAELSGYVDAKSHVKIAVSRARARLRELGYDIHSKTNVGYWITQDDKKSIEEKVNEFLGGNHGY